MKKIFCLCMILAVGSHSMQAEDKTYNYFSTARVIATGLLSLGYLGLSCNNIIICISPKILERVQKERNFNKDKHDLKVTTALFAIVYGIMGIMQGYQAYKFGRSYLKDYSSKKQEFTLK